jgi:hypothetical protein
MAGEAAESPQPHVLEIFDESSSDALACRVCGALVARSGDYPRIHWDWHEASNGA